MANLRKIHKRIKGVESTRQITKSMKMVAASKLRRTQGAFAAQRAFAERCEGLLAEVCADAGELEHPLLRPREEPRRVCYVLLLGNRGLCGGYNHELLRYAREQIEAEDREASLLLCGRWGKDILPGMGLPPAESFPISDSPDAGEARALAEHLREMYLRGETDEIQLLYQHYRSVLQQEPCRKQLLPLPLERGDRAGESRWLFEPDRDSLLDKLLRLYLDNLLHSVLLEARTGEHSARMTAMSAAADNTEELIGKLRLELNHARQAAITTEISEIAGGAAALQQSRDEGL